MRRHLLVVLLVIAGMVAPANGASAAGWSANTYHPWLNSWHETMVVWTPTTLEMWMNGKRSGATSGANVPTASLQE